ncbi:MAG TPA: hypothetical protein ENN53_01065 [Candidatus Acetothermia bacterium]|nr:hypothetical protein [Candidatus Acetothermia bacterium]
MVWAFVLLIGASAFADTLHLKTGQTVAGELCGVTASSIQWCAGEGLPLSFALLDVARVEFDGDPIASPRLTVGEWKKAMGQAQRELTSCRTARLGLILGGLAFVGGGYWLGQQGHEAGNFLIALGTVAAGLGVIATNPRCPAQEERVKVLVRIGLDHGWLY